jgi:4-amino-4-deoxy-L-arabinose transferase-like glycosyltransferase
MGVIALVIALLVPVFGAAPAPLSSDESLYLSEAYNIATGKGPTYTSGEIVNHRAPFYPALLSAPIAASGGDPDAAYVIPKLAAVALVAAVFLLGRALFGTTAGIIAALLLASNAFVRWLGTSLYLDTTQSLLLVLYLWSCWRAFETPSMPRFAVAGVLFALAFFTKETAIQWLPLPIAFALLRPSSLDRPALLGVATYTAVAVAGLLAWWAWVFAATGRVYFWGEPDAMLVVVVAAAVATCVALGAAPFLLRRATRANPRLVAAAGALVVVVWCIGMLLFLELTSWPYPKQHLSSIPAYLNDVAAGNTQPWPLLLGALFWLSWRARDSAAARFLALAVALFLPFALFVANRDFSYRDLLPIVCVAYVAAGAVTVEAISWLRERLSPPLVATAAAAGLAVLAFVQTQDLVDDRLPHDTNAASERDWDSPAVHALAGWIGENIPPGEGIMSSRLYFSQLYVLGNGRHPVYQLPTVRVEPVSDGPSFLRPVSTLFRWEDHRLKPAIADEPWLYLRRYPEKGYYVALSERDLLEDLAHRDVSYLVLTGEDAGFSSLSYLDYFLTHPAFQLVYVQEHSSQDAAVVFYVDKAQLGPNPYRAVVDPTTLAGLQAERPEEPRASLERAIDADGITLRGPGLPQGLSLQNPADEGFSR